MSPRTRRVDLTRPPQGGGHAAAEALRGDLEGLAEAFNSLFKAELIRNKGPWTGINDVEIAVAEYIDWFNQRRLHGELGHVPPAEHEALHVAAPVPEPAQKTS